MGGAVGVAVFCEVLRFFFGLPPDWDPAGTRKLPIFKKSMNACKICFVSYFSLL